MYTIYQLDKARNLRYGFKAFHQIEKKMEQKISSIDFDNLSMQDQAVLLWAGLLHEDPTLTPDDVMDLVDKYSTIGEAIRKTGEALAEAFGSGSGESGKNPAANSQ